MTDIFSLTANKLVEHLKSGQISSVEACTQYIERIEKFEKDVDMNKIFFSICIPGDNNKINLEELVTKNNDLKHQVTFWQELYLKAINPK